MSILEQLYDGNICPMEKCIKKDGEYYEINQRLASDIDKLMEQLNNGQKKLYEEIHESITKLSSISEKEIFIDGLRTGAQIVLEIFNAPESQLINI